MSPRELDPEFWKAVFASSLAGAARADVSRGALSDMVDDAIFIADEAVQAAHPDGCKCAFCRQPELSESH